MIDSISQAPSVNIQDMTSRLIVEAISNNYH